MPYAIKSGPYQGKPHSPAFMHLSTSPACIAHACSVLMQLCSCLQPAVCAPLLVCRYVGANGSALRMQAWLAICGRVLHLDVKTRWSSTRDMLEVALSLREQIAVWLSTLPLDIQTALHITDEQWADIQGVLQLLTPFAEATSRATRNDQPISFVLPLYNFMYYALQDFCTNRLYARYIQGIRKGMEVLDEYYGYTSHALSAATVLDPRANFYFFQKYQTCAGHETVAQALDHVRAELRPYLQAAQPVVLPDSQDQEDDIFGAPSAVIADELALYQKEPKLGQREDPLLWWKLNGARYPGLSKAARDHLSARSTSAPSERVFSHGRHVVTDFRGSLTAEHIKMCVLMKSWMTLLDN